MNYLTKSLCIAVIGFTLVLCENKGSSSLNDLTETLKSNFSGSIPGMENLPTDMPNLEDVQNALRKKCEESGGPGTFEKIESAGEEIKICFENLLNVTVLQDEVEEAKKTGSLDVVFGKYCNKVPLFEGCVRNYSDILELCLDSKEKDSKKVVLNVTKSLSEFVCHKSGDRIAMFIAEGGPECLTDKQNEIQECANRTIGKHLPTDSPSLESIPMLIFQESECNDIKLLQDCIVKSLQGCKDPTPSNIIESLFKFIVKMTPCAAYIKAEQTSAASIPSLSSIPFIIAGILISNFLVRL